MPKKSQINEYSDSSSSSNFDHMQETDEKLCDERWTRREEAVRFTGALALRNLNELGE